MAQPGGFEWRPLEASDLPLLATWLAEPQVRRWWNHDPSPEAVLRDFGPSVRGEEPGDDLVVLWEGRPIGLLQRSLIADYPDDHAEFAALLRRDGGPAGDDPAVPTGAVELDYLIGDASVRGRGVGSALIRAAVERVWAELPGTSTVLVAVVAANTASWRALERAGLTRVAEGPMTPDNPVDDPLHVVYRIDRPTSRLPTAGY